MREIVLVTGNPGKLRELQAIFPSDIGLSSKALDIVEIQGESHDIVSDKLERAYQQVGKPVIVEDVSAELSACWPVRAPRCCAMSTPLTAAMKTWPNGSTPSAPASALSTSYKNLVVVLG